MFTNDFTVTPPSLAYVAEMAAATESICYIINMPVRCLQTRIIVIDW